MTKKLRKQGKEQQERQELDLTYSCPPKIYGDLSKIKMHLNIYNNCILRKSQRRIQDVKSFSHRFADYLTLEHIANATRNKKKSKSFRIMAREAKRDQDTCCAQYQTFKEQYKENRGCKFHTLNLGHRCMSQQQTGVLFQFNLVFF